MKNIKFLCLAVIFTCFNANAALITFETRNITNGVNASDFVSSWNTQTSTVSSEVVTDFSGVKIGRDTIAHLAIELDITRDSTDLVFDLGLDAAYGAALYLDDALVANRTDDLWWANNWNHSDVFTVSLNSLTKDNKIIDIYWAEKCCDGASSIRFTNTANQLTALTTVSLDQATIPEPAGIALFGLALLGLAARRRSA